MQTIAPQTSLLDGDPIPLGTFGKDRAGTQAEFAYQPSGMHPGEEFRAQSADMAMVHEIGRILGDLYPDHLFGVLVSHRQGVIQLKLPMFTAYSWIIHTRNVTSPNDLWKKVMRGAGEFLERYGQPRARFDPDAFEETIKKLGPRPKMVHPDKVIL